MAYPQVVLEGELANIRVSRNQWVYFDIKDEEASVKCFGTVYSLPGPIEAGMKVRLTGMPRLHPQFGFSLTIKSVALAGEGTIKKAYDLLHKKLLAEGLFAPERKRDIPYPPQSIGLITSSESAAYADFIKILTQRFGGLEVFVADVQVQGDAAPGQIVRAIEFFNTQGDPPDVLVITRGGGSPDDLQSFNSEPVVRAVAGSRIPTLVAIGHEIDTTLAELAADLRASTPSNAAELLVPEKAMLLNNLAQFRVQAGRQLEKRLDDTYAALRTQKDSIEQTMERLILAEHKAVKQGRDMLNILDPVHILRRGYAIVKEKGRTVRSVHDVATGSDLIIRLADGEINAKVRE